MITGDEPINPTTEVGMNAEVSQGFGLTFKQHMVIEFTKAIITGTLSNETAFSGYLKTSKDKNMDFEVIVVKSALEYANEVIKQLN